VADHDQEVDALLNKVSRLDQPSDILAEISRQAKSRLTSSAMSPPPSEKEGVVGEETEPETDVLNVAETMRRSGHLWMKIASKYAVEVVESGPKAGSPAAGSPAALKKPGAGTGTPGAGSGMPDAAAELEAQRQKLVEVRNRKETWTSCTYSNQTSMYRIGTF
jgi:hypothetical protein